MAQLKANLNFTALARFLGERDCKKIGNNTTAEKFGENIVIRLHGNTIAVFQADGTMLITDGGWQSVTTKERLNHIFGISVWQKNHVWYISTSAGTFEFGSVNIIFADESVQIINNNDCRENDLYNRDYGFRLGDIAYWN